MMLSAFTVVTKSVTKNATKNVSKQVTRNVTRNKLPKVSQVYKSVLSGLFVAAFTLGSTNSGAEELCEFISANQWASFDSMPKVKVTEHPKSAQEYYDLAVSKYFDNLYDGRVTQSNIIYKNYLMDKLKQQADPTDSVARQINNKILELDGDVFDKDIRDMFATAAEKGHKEAQFCLGRIYEYGIGVKVSYVDSYSWYAVAASKMTPGGDALMWGVSQRLEGPEVSLAEKRAKNYIKQYAEM